MTSAAIVSIALRLFVLVAGADLVNRVQRRASAAERHWLWMLVLVGAIALPLAQRYSSPLQLLPWRATATMLPMRSAPAGASSPSVVEDEGSAVARNGSVAPTTTSPTRAMSGIETGDALSLLWLAGSLLCLARLASAHVRARRLVQRARSNPHRLTHAGTSVLVSDDVHVPFAYGTLSTYIVFPSSAAQWPAERLRAAVLHENAHVARRDGIALLLGELCAAIYWWHPAVWYAVRAAASERELACDDCVLRNGIRPSDYGRYLLAAADAVGGRGIALQAVVRFGHPHGIVSRVTAALDPTAARRRSSAGRLIGTAACIAGIVTVAGAASPRDSVAASTAQPIASRVPVSARRPVEVPSRRRTAVHVAPVVPRQNTPVVNRAICAQADPNRARLYSADGLEIRGAGSATDKSGATMQVWTGSDCVAWLRYRGRVDVTDDERNFVVGADAEITVHDDGTEGAREAVIRSDRTEVTLNGQRVALGQSERDWIASMAREYLRRTGARVQVRADAALRTGGIPALLAEAAAVRGRNARESYLESGFAVVKDPVAREEFVHRAAALLDSAGSRSRFLTSVPKEWLTDLKVLASVYSEAEVIEPDAGMEAVLAYAPPPRPLPPALRGSIQRMIASLSTVERRSALGAYYLDIRP